MDGGDICKGGESRPTISFHHRSKQKMEYLIGRIRKEGEHFGAHTIAEEFEISEEVTRFDIGNAREYREWRFRE